MNSEQIIKAMRDVLRDIAINQEAVTITPEDALRMLATKLGIALT